MSTTRTPARGSSEFKVPSSKFPPAPRRGAGGNFELGTLNSELPLAGVRVVDISWIAAGPLTAQWLANYGATVVRIESAVRIDGLRTSPPHPAGKFGIN